MDNLLSALGLCVFELSDPKQHLQDLHPQIRQFLRYPAEQAPSLFSILHPQDQPKFEQHLNALSASGYQQIEVRLQTPQGEWRWFEFRHTKSDPISGMMLEIEARKQADLAAETEMRLYQVLFENSPIGISVGEPLGEHIKINKKLCQILGYTWSPELKIDLLGQTLPEDVPANRAWVAKMIAREIPYFDMEKRYRRQDGSIRWVHLFGYPLWGEDGQLEYSISMTIDITERKILEQERQQLIGELETRNAEMERFIYTVSHDLKSPLITVQGFLGYLEKDVASGNMARVQRDMEHIHAAITRMYALLDDLLELSRVGRLTNPYESTLLDHIILEAIKNVAGQINKLHAVLTVQNGLPSVYADQKRIVEVFQNLLDNALKFMGNQPNPHIRIGASLEGEWVTCFVKDNGTGIDPAYHEKVFGLFDRIQTDVDGTGIGLALVKRIIEIHQGRIWIESGGNGQGCTFFFTLPHQEKL